MKFSFSKRQRVVLPISKIANKEFNALSCTKLAKLQNFSLFFSGGSGAASAEKAKRDGTFYFHF